MFNLIFNSPDKMLSVDTDNGDIELVSYINTRRVTVFYIMTNEINFLQAPLLEKQHLSCTHNNFNKQASSINL